MDKKLLFVIHGMPAGGAERVASIALAHWCSTGTDTTLLTFSSSDTDHYPLPPELKRVYANIFWDSHNALHSAISYLKRLGMIRREVKTVAPDVIVSFIDSTNVLVLIACLGTGIPVVVSERTDPREHVIKPLWRRLRKLVYRYADFIVVQTQNVAVWAQALTAADRVKVIANPLRTLDLPIPWDERTKDIIAVGRLVPLKGFDILIRAFAASTAPNQGWRLKIFGEGAERLALTALIEELSLRDAVDLCGITEDPTIELNRAKMFILSSKYEGFPNALMEGMAMGCACIATDCNSGPSDIIQHQHNGLLTPVDDVKAMTAAIDKLTCDDDLARQFASAAIDTRRRFSTTAIMAQWDALLLQTSPNNQTKTSHRK